MDSLNEREKHILTERRLADEPKTLEELSQVYGVSRERIRQIEVRAFEKLQAALLRLAGERGCFRRRRGDTRGTWHGAIVVGGQCGLARHRPRRPRRRNSSSFRIPKPRWR